MKFIAVASLGFAAIVSAQSTTSAAAAPSSTADATGCVKDNNDCIYAPDANFAQCAADNAACQTACQNADNECRVAPDANFSFCASQYASCLGENPYDPNTGSFTLSILGQSAPVTATVASSTSSPSAAAAANLSDTAGCKADDTSCRSLPDANFAQCAADNAACQTACQDADDECRTAPDANFSFCASEFASCLGENPYDPNTGSLTLSILGQSAPSATSSAASAVYTTEVVTALTTYCPAATSLTFNNQVYTVTSATTLIITDCPCTVTKASSMPVPSGPPATLVKSNGTASATVSQPAAYTGAAIQLAAAGTGLVAAVFGAIIFL